MLRRLLSPAVLLVVSLVGACGGGGSGDTVAPETRSIAVSAGDQQTAAAGVAVGVAPAVKISKSTGGGVSGIAVTFAVASGGGTVTGASATTDANGVATVGSWTLGTTPGANTLTATATSITGSPITFSATGTTGAAKTVTKVANTDAQNGTINTAIAVKPAIKVVDQFGNAVAGVAVTFAVASGGGTLTGATATTDATGVATVGSWTLGSAIGANSITATIAGTGITGNPATFTATAAFPVFSPTANTTLSGVQSFSLVNIPVGVTVTMTADLTLNVTGAVAIAGTLIGNCVNVTINSDGALTLTGNLNNGCTGTVPASLPAMTIAAKGGYALNAPGTWVAAGNVLITNDPTLTDADFPSGALFAASHVRAAGLASLGEPCTIGAFTGTAVPDHAQDGIDQNPTGTDGKDGSTWTLRCKGGSNISISGSLSLTGQNGGAGGVGTNTSATAAIAHGGKGGKGGPVNIQAIDNISFGALTNIKTGAGGKGGNATATGTGNGGTAGASADATGGVGGAPGLFTAVAKNGSIAVNGAFTLSIGSGGTGGDATSVGADGHDGATSCSPAVGGAASSTAGDGGSTPDKRLVAGTGVTGAASVTVNGGAPGGGGNALATAGKGGAGAVNCKAGAAGGDITARGGKGGDGNLQNLQGAKVANGGNGGKMEVRGGIGGVGSTGCLAIPVAGGAGGKGGATRGANGIGGSGLAPGTNGSATFAGVANGGDGASGNGPGAGGLAGDNTTQIVGTASVMTQPAFKPGTAGVACPVVTQPSTILINLVPTVPIFQVGVVQPGTYAIPITDQNNVTVGSMNMIAEGPAGNTFYGSNPGRLGWNGAAGSWTADIGSLLVNAATYVLTSWTVCILNSNVDALHAVQLDQFDAALNLLTTTNLTQNNTCTTVSVNPMTKKIRTSKSGNGTSADMNGIRGGNALPMGAIKVTPPR